MRERPLPGRCPPGSANCPLSGPEALTRHGDLAGVRAGPRPPRPHMRMNRDVPLTLTPSRERKLRIPLSGFRSDALPGPIRPISPPAPDRDPVQPSAPSCTAPALLDSSTAGEGRDRISQTDRALTHLWRSRMRDLTFQTFPRQGKSGDGLDPLSFARAQLSYVRMGEELLHHALIRNSYVRGPGPVDEDRVPDLVLRHPREALAGRLLNGNFQPVNGTHVTLSRFSCCSIRQRSGTTTCSRMWRRLRTSRRTGRIAPRGRRGIRPRWPAGTSSRR